MAVVDFAWDLVATVWRLVTWVLMRIWRFTRGFVSTLMPGQPSIVHTAVAIAVVAAEIVGVWYALVRHAAGS